MTALRNSLSKKFVIRRSHNNVCPTFVSFLTDPTFVEPQPNPKEIMVYHSFNVTHPYVAINVEVSVSRPDAQLVVFMKRGNKPNLTHYDWVWKVQLPVNFTVDISQEPMEEPIPITTAVPMTTIRVPTCEELEGVNATRGTNQTCIPGAVTEPSVMCEEDLITVGSTTPAPTTTAEPMLARMRGNGQGQGNGGGGQDVTSTTEDPTTQQTDAQCTPVLVTPTPTDGSLPDAEPVEPTNYISEYVRLRVVPNRALEPYDPYGNDSLLYSFPLYDIFVPDWYVDNMNWRILDRRGRVLQHHRRRGEFSGTTWE
ncbi:hypothetical protein FJT64_009600 [Amphibalanus amphitrite]|uniref:Uncharacterized protein n=1 Tax=Amphibalanus amphitrite TaxID=1232801 RepID=A0A6A4VSW7_AMPAM|nr:hypothetical protein FJT64_009600 [Amphibalanus amphitrite]